MTSRDPHALANYKAALKSLIAEDRSKRDISDDVNSATASLFRIISALESLPSLEVKPDKSPIEKIASAPIAAGLTLAEAAFEVLKSSTDRKPMLAPEIISKLEASGYEVTASHSRSAVNSALNRRFISQLDVVPVGKEGWALSEWFSEKKLASLRHAAVTRHAMSLKKAKGTTFGARPMLSKDQIAEFRRMLERNEKSRAICDKFGISRPTYYNYKRRIEQMNELTEDDTSGASHVRLVKS